MRKTMIWVLYLAIVYVAVCATFYLMQARLVYFPAGPAPLTPGTVGLGFDDLQLRTEDGVTVHGWAVAASPRAPWVLYCHGNGGNIAGRLGVVTTFYKMGLSVLMFDYRGYGRSEGCPSEAGLYQDAEAAWQYLTQTRRVAPSDIVIWGESLGGGVATWLAERHPPRALVLQSTFTSVPDVGAPLYPWLPVRLLCSNVFPSRERIGRILCPALFLHAKDDPVIPYANGRALFEASREPHQWMDIEGGHNGGLSAQPPPVLDEIRSFIFGAPAAAPDAPGGYCRGVGP